MDNSKIVQALGAAEYHWHFTQGNEAIDNGLLVPGLASILNGIEASIRCTINQLNGNDITQLKDLGPVLSNGLLLKAHNFALPINQLSFPEEKDFGDKLNNKKTPVELVRVRNNICHGNIIEYVQEHAGAKIFIPEYLSNVSDIVQNIAFNWAIELGKFKDKHLLTNHSNGTAKK